MAQAGVRLVGVEHELRIWSGTRQLDFRRLLPEVTPTLRALDPGDPRARRLPSGVALTADGREAELATPPVPWDADAPMLLDELLAGERSELAAVSADIVGADRLTGYSTHVNLDVPDERVLALGATFAKACGLVAALVGEPSTSAGLLIRPRRGRLEVCGEYAEGGHLRALVTFVGSAVSALLDGSGPPPTPEPVVVPSREKYGWFLPPEGVYAELLSRPRPHGSDLLVSVWSWARPWCVRDGLDPAVVDRLVEGEPLRCEDPTAADVCTVLPRTRAARAGGRPTGPRHRPGGIDGETVWLTWRHVAWSFTNGRRRVYAVMPVSEEQEFLSRVDDGAYDESLARELSRRWGRRTLLVHSQVDDALWWHDLRPGALVPAERDAEGRVPKVSRRLAAQAHRADRRRGPAAQPSGDPSQQGTM